jgi:hypothetical protein
MGSVQKWLLNKEIWGGGRYKKPIDGGKGE